MFYNYHLFLFDFFFSFLYFSLTGSKYLCFKASYAYNLSLKSKASNLFNKSKLSSLA